MYHIFLSGGMWCFFPDSSFITADTVPPPTLSSLSLKSGLQPLPGSLSPQVKSEFASTPVPLFSFILNCCPQTFPAFPSLLFWILFLLFCLDNSFKTQENAWIHVYPPPTLPNVNKFFLLQVVFVFWRNKTLPAPFQVLGHFFFFQRWLVFWFWSLFHKYICTLARYVRTQNSIKVCW